MSESFDVDQYYELMKVVSGISVQDEWQEVVKSHLVTAHKMANIIEQAPIDVNSLEFSNCFIPGKTNV